MKQINYQLIDCTEVEKNYMINHKTIACGFIEISTEFRLVALQEHWV